MDKEEVAQIYNGMLLSHKKGKMCAICRDMDGPRDCHTERSKSEREKYCLNVESRKTVQMNLLEKQK